MINHMHPEPTHFWVAQECLLHDLSLGFFIFFSGCPLTCSRCLGVTRGGTGQFPLKKQGFRVWVGKNSFFGLSWIYPNLFPRDGDWRATIHGGTGSQAVYTDNHSSSTSLLSSLSHLCLLIKKLVKTPAPPEALSPPQLYPTLFRL
jgi:hypothetical protein